MNKAAALGVIAVAAGFLLGFAWGRGTRDALSENTTTDISSGVLTVRVDARNALSQGLAGLLS